MKEINNTTLYVCDYCGKYYQKKHSCLSHEQYKCGKNPQNKHICLQSCKHLTKTDEVCDHHIMPIHYKSFRCAISGEEMFTYKVENRCSILRDLLGGAIRMPLACDDYEKECE